MFYDKDSSCTLFTAGPPEAKTAVDRGRPLLVPIEGSYDQKESDEEGFRK